MENSSDGEVTPLCRRHGVMEDNVPLEGVVANCAHYY